jgi:hypothetical protein
VVTFCGAVPGWGERIRTPALRARAACPAARRLPNDLILGNEIITYLIIILKYFKGLILFQERKRKKLFIFFPDIKNEFIFFFYGF